MDEEIRNMVDSAQNIPPEPAAEKQKILWFPLSVFIAVLIMTMAGYFIISNINKEGTTAPLVSINDESEQNPVALNNTGSSVDHATYLQLQDLMGKTEFSKPEIVENTLRFFDIDGDGDQDVLGFLKLTPYQDANYRFSTWLRDGTEFDYYTDSYNDFTLIEKLDGVELCSFYDLAIGRVTLDCSDSEQEYFTTLRYQKDGIGYYRDVDAHVVLFNNNANWPEYSSKKGGISFNYPPDVQVIEKTYEIYNDFITIVTAKRNNQTLFEIETAREHINASGGRLPGLARRMVFLRLSDGTYLSRYWLGGESNSQELGVFYYRTEPYEVNNVGGAIFASSTLINVDKGRNYALYSPLTSENNLKEIDNIFASIKYIETPAIKDAETITTQTNSISLSNIVTLQVPGNVIEHQPKEKEPNDIVAEFLDITFINSQIYQPSQLLLKLISFGSVGEVNVMGGGGYDANKNGCYNYEKENISAPQKIGINHVCKFGYSEGGFSSQGYYILDPNRKYILIIEYGTMLNEDYYPDIINIDLEPIVESVKFTQ